MHFSTLLHIPCQCVFMWLGNKNGWHFISIYQLSSQAVTCFMQICFIAECTPTPYLLTSICFLIQLSNYKWMDTLKGKDATNFNKTVLSYCEIYNRKVRARGCRELQYSVNIQKLISDTNFVESCLPVTYFTVNQLFWNFAQSSAATLPYSVQNFKTIAQLRWMLWMNEIWV